MTSFYLLKYTFFTMIRIDFSENNGEMIPLCRLSIQNLHKKLIMSIFQLEMT